MRPPKLTSFGASQPPLFAALLAVNRQTISANSTVRQRYYCIESTSRLINSKSIFRPLNIEALVQITNHTKNKCKCKMQSSAHVCSKECQEYTVRGLWRIADAERQTCDAGRRESRRDAQARAHRRRWHRRRLPRALD